ncbi:hypothetical protein [Marinimicrococcus flavescens]|uniref:Glutamine amidotransferase domain-containing protein n=1 Tax=Marinimicrococcus flavescens TaxID=3031815 RepID=A0AAP3XRY8_9PROT|nr:hypothetical protein [Marinimicrococcus flavescens]
MTSGFSLLLAPHLPWEALAGLALLALLLVGWGLAARARGALLRLLFAALLLGALANPVLRREERQPLDDVVVLLADRSPSQELEERPERTAAALAGMRERLAGQPHLQVREVEVRGASDGTALFERLESALGEIDRDRLAGILAVTDGAIHDAPSAAPGFTAPLHVLLTGRPDEVDRRLVVEQAPSFAMVGEPQSLVVRVVEQPGGDEAGAVPLVLRQDGRIIREAVVAPGQTLSLPFTLDKPGRTVMELEAAAREGELTTLNNRTTVEVTGVRDRLRVLLVSGQPYPGLRVWRNLLKADPAVDLVHFTILRPPEKQDGTPIRELALIAFPSRELFEVKLDEFDLVIFDRYNRRGLLPLPYLENVAAYVEAGGALLEAAGPEFASPTSLFRTPLARVLPGRPSGEVLERPYTPAVTALGRRHPVTGGLAEDPAEPGWGRWFRQIDVEATDAQVLMTGVADRPLLLLDEAGQGRVAQLLSDHAWLWARGYEQGGPQAALLRRLVHWLMKEPELEAEALSAAPDGEGIAITRRTLGEEPVTLTVTRPDGTSTELRAEPDAEGIARTAIPAEADGLYRITDGTRTAYATPRPVPMAELADMRATPAPLAPAVEATGGSTRWLAQEGLPDLRRVAPDRRRHGRGWIGLVENRAYTVTGATETALLPAWLALTLLLATAATAWWREGRT